MSEGIFILKIFDDHNMEKTQYILLVHGNAKTLPSAEEWDDFFKLASDSGLFKGGSEIGERVMVGEMEAVVSSQNIVGYMRFDSGNRQSVIDLLERHPVVVHGGTVELCEMPRQ